MAVSMVVAALIVFSLAAPVKGNEMQDFVIQQHPSSILIPRNEEAMFKCMATCQSTAPCRLYWVLNRTHDFHPIADEVNCSTLSRSLICFSLKIKSLSSGGFQQELTLTLNTSLYVNDTEIFCRNRPSGNAYSNQTVTSKSATLIVISDPPILPNPSARKENAGQVAISWSPPFLWPGHRIQSYNISWFTLNGEGIGSYAMESSGYTSDVVSITVDVCQGETGFNGVIIFVISATNTSNVTLQSVRVSETNTSSTACNTHGIVTSEALGNSKDSSDVLSYKIATIVGVSLAVVFLLLLIAVMSSALLFRYRKKQKEKKVNGTKDRLYKTMILNPIYDGNGHSHGLQPGPVYEDIKPPEPKGNGPGPDYRHAPMTAILQTELSKAQLPTPHTIPRISSNKDYPDTNGLSSPYSNGGPANGGPANGGQVNGRLANGAHANGGRVKVAYGNVEYYDV